MKKHLFSILMIIACVIVSHAQPTTFNYQSVIRDSNGDIIQNQSFILKLTILNNSGTDYYIETHNVTTNNLGQIQVPVGAGNILEGSLITCPWGTQQLLLKTEISMDSGTTFEFIGQSPLLSVPYAFYSASGEPGNGIESITDNGNGTLTFNFTNGSSYTTPNLAGPTIDAEPGNLIYHDTTGWVATDVIKIAGDKVAIGTNPAISRLLVKGDSLSGAEDPIFEVKNKDGAVVFAVYDNGVEINVDDSGIKKGVKGGFAVGGLSGTKSNGNEYLRVTPDSTRIYVKETVKGVKGGFAVGGLSGAKSITRDFLHVSPDSVRVYIDNSPTKGVKGGFAVGGLSGTKEGVSYFLDLTTENYFIGHESGSNRTTGLYNSVMGYQAGYSITEGNSNALIGYQSGYNNTIGSGNLFLGYQTGFSNEFGNYNTFLGYVAGYSNTTGVYNTFLGSFSGFSNDVGYHNTFVGDSTGFSNTNGDENTFVGTKCGLNNITGNSNVFIGNQSGYNTTDGNINIFIGNRAGYSSIASESNVFIGHVSGYNNIDGGWNVFIGNQSGHYNISGSGNVFLGHHSGWHNTSGGGNVSVGSHSGYSNETGISNVFVGQNAGALSKNGDGNTVLGAWAADEDTLGTNNVMIGATAGRKSIGDRNVMIGHGAGYHNKGNASIFIGEWAGANETGSEKLYIENSDRNSSEALIYGEFDNDYLKLNATVSVRDMLQLTPQSTPPTGELGSIYVGTDNKLYFHDGTAWKEIVLQAK